MESERIKEKRMTGKRKFAALLLALVCMVTPELQSCGQPESQLEESPDLMAPPSPEESSGDGGAPQPTGPLATGESPAPSASPAASPDREDAGGEATPAEALSPLTGRFSAVNNFLEGNGAGTAVGDILSAEEIQAALVAHYTDALPHLDTLSEERRVMDILTAAPVDGGDSLLVVALLRDSGEEEPRLHKIRDGKVTRVSGGSAWWINYTWVDGRYVFYGLGGLEPLPGNSAFISQSRDGNTASFPLRDGKWFLAAMEPGADFPADLYFQQDDGARLSDQQTGLFHHPDQEILKNKLLYYPLLPAGMQATVLSMQEGDDIAVESPLLLFSWRAEGDADPVPPAVVWRDANLMFTVFKGQRNLRFATMDGVMAAYIARVDGDDGTGDGADRLQAIDLAQVRENDGKLPRPSKAGEYAYVVDVDLDGGTACYGLPFRVEQSGE